MRKFIVRALSYVGLLLVALSAQAQQYSLTDLGSLGGGNSYATGINFAGQVVGQSTTSGNTNHAFLYSNGSMQDLGTLGGTGSEATGINSAGQVVGWSTTTNGTTHAFLWTSSNGMQDLGTLGGTISEATGINSAGQVVGWSTTINGSEHAFLWTSSNGMQDLGTLGGTGSEATGINDNGQVVGDSITTNDAEHAFLWTSSSGMQDLGTLGGAADISYAYGVNATGQVTGYSFPAAGGARAFIYNGSMQDLGVPTGGIASEGYGINKLGQVVGVYYYYLNNNDAQEYSHAFLYSNGQMTDLNTLDTSSSIASQVTLEIADAINDSGWIVAFGLDSSTNQQHAYLLMPVAVVPPTAVAGPNQTISAGQLVSLNGLGSYAPNTSSASLEYAWSFVSIPSGSGATLSGANTATPSFLADEPGTYVVQLIVTDPATDLSSNPSQVTISSTWTPPTANAGAGQSTVVGTPVLLSGSGTDPNGLALSYAWSFVSVPSGSTATLANANTQNASFEPDVAGSYTVELIVSDSIGSSAPSPVTISVISAADYAQQQIGNAINYVASMPVSQFQAPGHRESMINLLQEAIAAIQAGDTVLANQKLTSAISRTDGYPLRGAVDGQGPGMDWIVDPTAQNAVYTDLLNALNVLP